MSLWAVSPAIVAVAYFAGEGAASGIFWFVVVVIQHIVLIVLHTTDFYTFPDFPSENNCDRLFLLTDSLFFSIVFTITNYLMIRTTQNQDEAEVKSRENIMAMLSHEMRTPLHAVMGHLDLFLGDFEDLDEDLASKIDIEGTPSAPQVAKGGL